MRRALRPSTPGDFTGLVAPAPTCRRSARAWQSHARHPGDFLMRRKSPKTHQGPPGLEFEELLTSGEGGAAPFDPPAFCPSGIVRNNLNPQASSMAMYLPRHRLKVESVPSIEPKEKTKTDLPTNSKWQIGLFLWLKALLGGSSTMCCRGSEASPSGEYPEGCPLWEILW